MRTAKPDSDSGEEALRRGTFVRRHAGNLAPMARDVQVPLTDLDSWALGLRAHLDAPMLERVAVYLHGERVSYDAVTDKLRRRPQQAMPVSAYDWNAWHEAMRKWRDAQPPTPVSAASFRGLPNTTLYAPPASAKTAPRPKPRPQPGWAE